MKGFKEIDKKRLFSTLLNKNLCLFVGSVISRNYPSNLPLTHEYKKSFLNQLCSSGSLKNHKALVLSENNLEYFYNNLPFEYFCEKIVDLLEPIKAEFLNIYTEKKDFNPNHLMIARLARLGYILGIFTTNFDTLLEAAFKIEFKGTRRGWEVIKDEQQFKKKWMAIKFREKNDNLDNECFPIYKLHGCISDFKEDPENLTFMLKQSAKGLSYYKKQILLSSLEIYPFLFIGYGARDLDISPLVYHTKSRNMIWNVRNKKVIRRKTYLFDLLRRRGAYITESNLFNESNVLLQLLKKVDGNNLEELELGKGRVSINFELNDIDDFNKYLLLVDYFIYLNKGKESLLLLKDLEKRTSNRLSSNKKFQIYFNKGRAYKEFHSYFKALTNFKKSRAYAESSKEYKDMAIAEREVGYCYRMLEEHYWAHYYLDKSVNRLKNIQGGGDYKSFNLIDAERKLCDVKLTLGLRGELNQEYFYDLIDDLRRLNKEARKYGAVRERAGILHVLGICYVQVSKYSSALNVFTRSLKLFDSIGIIRGNSIMNRRIATTLLSKPRLSRADMIRTENCLKESIESGKELSDHFEQLKSYYQLSKFRYRQGNTINWEVIYMYKLLGQFEDEKLRMLWDSRINNLVKSRSQKS